MRFALLVAFALAWASPAAAQHAHGAKGPNGGQMEDVAGVHVELLTAGSTVTLNVFDEGSKPVSTTGFSASALVTAGSNRETLTLTPQGQNSLRGEAKSVALKGATISITLKAATGKSGQVRFKQ
ncbi:hypothetical protein AFEL58S_00020 [Afipia felis]|jgi:hypothetical protein